MYADESRAAPAGRRPVKVSLPLRQCIQLRALWLFGGQSPSEVVEEALEQYFERRRGQTTREAAAGAAATGDAAGAAEERAAPLS